MIGPKTLAKIDPFARKLGFYTAYTLSEREFVGEVDYAIPGVHWYLPEKADYEPSPSVLGVELEAAKYHPADGTIHTESYRKVDPKSPRWQWHVHVWDRVEDSPAESYHQIFSHYEMRPDLKRIAGETLADVENRLRVHYRPSNHSTDEGYLEGVACDDVKELVS